MPSRGGEGECMKEELLSIGEFAKLRGVSVKSLRYYERVGALKPAYVNAESGYRYYSINQISDLDMVITFIELGVPLKEIASTAALGYGQGELIEKGRELARERIARAEAQLLQLDRYADEIAESQRFQSKRRYEREFAPLCSSDERDIRGRARHAACPLVYGGGCARAGRACFGRFTGSRREACGVRAG